MAYLKINMQQPQMSTLDTILQFVKDSLPMIGGIIAIWKTINEIAKAYSKKQDARLRELIKTEVNPQIENLTDAINDLRETIGQMRARQ